MIQKYNPDVIPDKVNANGVLSMPEAAIADLEKRLIASTNVNIHALGERLRDRESIRRVGEDYLITLNDGSVVHYTPYIQAGDSYVRRRR